MIEGLRLTNFKSIKDLKVDFGRLTVLVGPNNSGKSTLMESLVYLEEAIGESKGPLINQPAHLGAEFDDWGAVFHRGAAIGSNSMQIVPRFDMSESSLYKDLVELCKEAEFNNGDFPRYCWIGADINLNNWRPEYHGEIDGELVPLAWDDEGALSTQLTSSSFSIRDNGVFDLRTNREDADVLIEALQETAILSLSNTYYITDSRDIGSWKQDPQEHDFVGRVGQNTVAMLHALRDHEEKFERVTDAISGISPEIDELSADMYGTDTKAELKDMDVEYGINVVASGAGLRRLLPIIVQISAAEEGDTIMIEEPEISVYPRIQERLLEYMIEAVERGVQIIMSTHSHPMLWKIMNNVDNRLGHGLEFSKEAGETNVEKRPLDRLGSVEEYYG